MIVRRINISIQFLTTMQFKYNKMVMANFRQILHINHSFGIAIIRMCTSLGFQSYYLIHFSLFGIHYFSRVPVKNGVIQALKMAFCIHKQFEHINQILYGLKQWLQANSICKKSRVKKIRIYHPQRYDMTLRKSINHDC